MKATAVLAIIFVILGVNTVLADSMVISRNAARHSRAGPAENFIGSVMAEPLYTPNATTSNSGSYVTFAPGARSAWHSHPGGQILIVTDGAGWVQEEGGEKHEIKAGDVIWTPPGVKHWHGATATTSMRHIAITNFVDGRNVEWMEQVTDAQYNQPTRPEPLK